MNVLSLFAGIGGLELGLERAGMTVVGQVEIDHYCRRVLAKHWPNVPRHDDVRTAAEWWLSTERPTVDVICGGFPCQDISAAGRRAGIIDGERSSLWSFMADAIRRIRPRYVLVENVPRVLVRGGDGVIPAEFVAADLATLGYDLRWDCIPAAAVGAPHLRDRWFGVAYSHREQLRVEPVSIQRRRGATEPRDDGSAQPLANAIDRPESQESPGGCDGEQSHGAGISSGGGVSGRMTAHRCTGDVDSCGICQRRIDEIEWHRGAPLDPAPLRHVVNLTKRVRIDADWCRRNRTTPEQQQRITDELRAVYGDGVRVGFGVGA